MIYNKLLKLELIEFSNDNKNVINKNHFIFLKI